MDLARPPAQCDVRGDDDVGGPSGHTRRQHHIPDEAGTNLDSGAVYVVSATNISVGGLHVADGCSHHRWRRVGVVCCKDLAVHLRRR